MRSKIQWAIHEKNGLPALQVQKQAAANESHRLAQITV